jgi:hypothetical protein
MAPALAGELRCGMYSLRGFISSKKVALEVLEMVYASLGDCCMKIQSLIDVWFGAPL